MHQAPKVDSKVDHLRSRSNITRLSRRSLLGFSKPIMFELYNMKGRMKLYAERESGHSLSFGIFTPAAGPESELLPKRREIDTC